jgi:hypothetical protein
LHTGKNYTAQAKNVVTQARRAPLFLPSRLQTGLQADWHKTPEFLKNRQSLMFQNLRAAAKPLPYPLAFS